MPKQKKENQSGYNRQLPQNIPTIPCTSEAHQQSIKEGLEELTERKLGTQTENQIATATVHKDGLSVMKTAQW